MESRSPRHPFRLLLAAPAIFALALGAACAQSGQKSAVEAKPGATAYEPAVGQSGKDVVWVPTPDALVNEMLRMAEVTPQDYLVDLGSGDGRTVIAAARRGTRAHGIEFNPDMVELSRQAAQKAGVTDRATFVEGDVFKSDFSAATVVTLFLLPELNLRLRPILLDMKPGTRVVSNSFHMGDWTADDTVEAGSGCSSYCRAYKWIVPAKVAGAWELNDKTMLALDQTYQNLNGQFTMNGTRHQVTDAKLAGTRITFTANGRQFTGEVDADRMSGRDSEGNAWTATRRR